MRRFQKALEIGSSLAILSAATTALHAAPDRTWTYTYNDSGQVLSADGPRDDVEDITRYSYDSSGNLVSTTNALEYVTRMALYNQRGQPGQITDPNGVVTRLLYDELGRLTDRITDHPGGNPDLSVHDTFRYDPITGRLLSKFGSSQTGEDFRYDRAGRLISRRNSSAEIRFNLDNLGNPLSVETWESNDDDGHDAMVTRTTWRYDELGRMITRLGSDSQVYHTYYDRNSNIIREADAQGRSTSRGYDALDRMVSEVDELDHATAFSYDARDNTAEVSDKRQLSTRYGYDGHDNRTELASPDTGASTFTYDAAGNLLTATDAQGYQSVYSYDALNRLLSVNYPGYPSKNISYTYDIGPSCNYCKGRLASISDSSGVTRFSYDFAGRVVSRTNIVEIPNGQPISLTTSFSYDPGGRPTGITYPNGETITYNWGKIDSIEEGEVSLEPGDYIWSVQWQSRSGAAERSLVDFVDFDPYGPVNHLRYGNGLELERQHDLDGRLETQTIGDIQNLSYHYNSRNLVTLIEDHIAPQRTEAFAYDATGRLLSANGLYGAIDYAYDANGNRTAKAVSHFTGDSQETYIYAPDSNQLESASIESGASLKEFEFSYDERGNLTRETESGATRMISTYGADNRMDSTAR